MQDLVIIQDSDLITTSKIIADVFGKAHHNILKAIANLDCSDEFRSVNFNASYYLSPQNKKLKCINLTRDGFTFLAMGLTGKKAAHFKEAYINAFNQMEKGLLNVDKRIQKLHIEGKELKSAGKNWSKVGHEIRRMKKDHENKVIELMSDVQMELDF